jgi:hypothetical protein
MESTDIKSNAKSVIYTIASKTKAQSVTFSTYFVLRKMKGGGVDLAAFLELLEGDGVANLVDI